MASKLDQIIAKAVIEAARNDTQALLAVAAELAPQVTDVQAAKLPERWYPKISAKVAGVPEQHDCWPRAWFEGLVELLFQKEKAGIPALIELWQRDKASYLELVALRLLRLASADVDRTQILARIADRLPEVHITVINRLAQIVVVWSERERQVMQLLRQFAEIEVKHHPGLKVGDYLDQHEAEQAEIRCSHVAPSQ